MRQILSALTGALLAFAVAHVSTAGPAPKQQPAPPPAPEPVKQIRLTEQQVQGFIAAQADMAPIMQRLAAARGQPDQRTMAALEAAAKKHGFASLEDYGDVESNVGLVMSGIDPQTKQFSEPP